MKLKNYQAKANEREVPEGFPNKPFLGLIYASKGLGKTNLLINLVHKFDETKTYQKVYLFSPSVQNDPKYQFLYDGKYDLKVYPNYTDEIMRDVIDEINDDLNEWKEYQRLKALYDKSKKAESQDLFNDEELLDLFMMDWEAPMPPKYNREPWSLIIFDDLASNAQLMKQGKSLMNSFALLHRHRNTSMIYAVQLYRNAVPKMIRNNLDLWVLGKSKSEENMKSVAEELTSYATTKEVIDKWNKATEEPYSFFCVNLMAKTPELRFTRNFNEPV